MNIFQSDTGFVAPTSEELKGSLMRQFKEDDAGIHWLMTDFSNTLLNYFPKKRFLIQEYNLILNVETIDDEKAVFQLSFEDYDNNADTSMESIYSAQFPDEHFVSRERVYLGYGQIVFGIEHWMIETEEFSYKATLLNPSKSEGLWVFDLKSKEMTDFAYATNNSKAALDSSLALVRRWWKEAPSRYSELVVTQGFINRLVTMMNNEKIDGLHQREILDAFSAKGSSVTDSKMSTVIRNLFEIKNP